MSKILIVGPGWVGDVVMAQSLLTSIRLRTPEAVIDVLAPGWSGPLLARMPEVRRHIEMPVGHGSLGLGIRYRLGRALRPEHYDQAIVLPNSLKSALTPFFAGIPRRTGYRGETRYGLINDTRTLDEEVLVQVVQRYVALGQDRGDPLPPANIPPPRLRIDATNQGRLVKEFSLATDRSVTGFAPGAEFGPSKRWPAEYFGELAVQLQREGRDVWLFGSAKDQQICAEIALRAGGRVRDLSGKTPLEDVVDLIAATDELVGNDSGLTHLAAATGRRVIAIYGSTSPDKAPPLADRAESLSLRLECSPCGKRECPFGHYRCLRDLSVDRVLAAVLTRDGT